MKRRRGGGGGERERERAGESRKGCMNDGQKESLKSMQTMSEKDSALETVILVHCNSEATGTPAIAKQHLTSTK